MALASVLTHLAVFGDSSGGLAAAIAAFGIIGFLIFVAVIVFYLAAYWRIFSKAGKPGWACIIPIYNIIVLLQVVGRPVWWFLLFLIPVVDIIILFIILHDLSKSYGHDIGFTLGLIFLGFIFIPVLAFGSSRYVGPAAATVPMAMPVGGYRQ